MSLLDFSVLFIQLPKVRLAQTKGPKRRDAEKLGIKCLLSDAMRPVKETDQHSFRQFGRHRKTEDIVNVEWTRFKLEKLPLLALISPI